jgi:hypothetical protein
MVWEFKQLLFVSQRRFSPQAVADLSNPAVRAQLQAHIDASGTLPALGDAEEYAALFEAVYPAEADRRAYLDSKVAGARPSYGHLALATLMQAQLARILWTPNFDSLVADACAKVYDTTGSLTTVTLDGPDLAAQVIADGRWPVEIKLHGDFRSRRLKNTNDELRQQDTRFRQVLVNSCRRFGLVVVGYSGRDSSIVDTLMEATEHNDAFPAGLFWLHRDDSPPAPRVGQLLARAVDKKIEAGLVQIENFDEALRDIIRLVNDLDMTALNGFTAQRRRRSAAPVPTSRRGWPVVRLNALPLVQSPSLCRKVVCQIEGYVEVREAIQRSGVNVLAARTKAGVLAFGADADVRSAFVAHGISDFALHTIELNRLRYESGERGLLRAALASAIERYRGLRGSRHRSADFLVPTEPDGSVWSPLRDLVGTLNGTIANHPELVWREGIAIRLDWADDRLWLLIEPRTVFEGITDDNRASATDFARERTIRRYNRQLNDLISFWSATIASEGSEIRALDVSDGVDAVFRLSRDTAYSRRAQI